MFKYVILLCAFFVAICAGVFSVSGISQLFIGAHIATLIMAISLETGKLAVVSFVYRYWKNVNRLLKIYMTVGAIILSGITSLGIFGYLHSAYASAAIGFSTQQAQIASMSTQQTSIDTIVARNRQRVSELQSYRTQQEARLDQLVGKTGFVTQQRIIGAAETDITNIQRENSRLLRERDSIETRKTELMNVSLTTNNKIGTFWYISRQLGVPLDKLVNWFIVAIVLVFDPLSVALILAYNFLVRTEISNKKVSGELKEDEWIPPKPFKSVTKLEATNTENVLEEPKVDENVNVEKEVVPTVIPTSGIPRAAPPYPQPFG